MATPVEAALTDGTLNVVATNRRFPRLAAREAGEVSLADEHRRGEVSLDEADQERG